MRRTGLFFLLAILGVLLAGMFYSLHRDSQELLLGVELRGERGMSRGRLAEIRSGERFRMEVRLGRPAAVLVLLEDGEGRLREVYPPPGEVPLIDAGERRLPPGDAWESSQLDRGIQSLFVLAASEPVTVAARESARARLAGADPAERMDLLEELRSILGVDGLAAAREPFWVE